MDKIPKMDAVKVEKLIEIVRDHIFLYDLSHQQYKNANLKTVVWEKIGRELNESGEAVKNKWKTIRDGYTKYKKQLRKSDGNKKKVVNYTWASHLTFLDCYDLRGSSRKISSDAPQSSPCNETLDSYNTLVTPTFQDLGLESPASSSTRLSYRKNKRRSEDRSDEDDVERVIQYYNAKKKKEYDIVDHLFLSYADTFKKFPPREQAIVKLELARLFSNTELQLLNSNSTESHDAQYASYTSPEHSDENNDKKVDIKIVPVCEYKE